MYDEKGQTVWETRLDIYGKVHTFAGRSLSDCPFRYQGQYEDQETGLYYNRFRYYSPEEGMYLSQDPIGLAGGNKLYSYVHDINKWTDPIGLVPLGTGGFSVYALYEQGAANPYYIGITNQNIDTRMSQHFETGRYGETTIHRVLESNLTIEQARGFEQAYIEHYGTKTGIIGEDISPTNRGNKINSFDKSRTDIRGQAFNVEYEKAKQKIKGGGCC
jgi:RHS repeat-associated protein